MEHMTINELISCLELIAKCEITRYEKYVILEACKRLKKLENLEDDGK